jgi:hypothetical protein
MEEMAEGMEEKSEETEKTGMIQHIQCLSMESSH